MSETVTENIDENIAAGTPLPQETEEAPAPFDMRGFKSVCLRIGLVISIAFLARFALEALSAFTQKPLNEALGDTAGYILDFFIDQVFLYVLPIAAAYLILKQPNAETRCRIYSKPQYLGRAFSSFPVIYFLGIAVNTITIIITALINSSTLGDSYSTIENIKPLNEVCAVFFMIRLVVCAPLFEEFWFRGIVLESLRPYGNGFAIFISGFLFGLMHANFGQFFYAFVIGISFGYIAVSTKSIVSTTIFHAVFNSIGGAVALFYTSSAVQDYFDTKRQAAIAEALGEPAVEMPEPSALVVAFLVFIALIYLTVFVGFIMFLFKLGKLKKFRVPKVQTEVGGGKRLAIYLSRWTVILSLLLAAVAFLGLEVMLIRHFLV